MEVGAAGWASQKAVLILQRGDLDICSYCHVALTDETRTIDHVIPKSKGGTNALENLCLACADCNRDKEDSDVADFLLRLRIHRAKAGSHKFPLLRKKVQPKRRLTHRPIVGLAPWDQGHEEARQRIQDVKRVNHKGFPDP